MMVKENSTNTIKIIIPKNSNLSDKRSELLEDLKSIPDEDLEKMGNDFYFNSILKDIENGNYDNLDKNAAITMINHGFDKSVLNKIDKFKGLDIDVANALIEKKDFNPGILKYFNKADRKAIILNAIEHSRNDSNFLKSLHSDSWLLALSNCDLKFANDLIKAGCPNEILEHKLCRFKQNDRAKIALIALKNGAESISFDCIPSNHLDLHYAIELFDNHYDPRDIARNLDWFKQEDRVEISVLVIKNGSSTAGIESIPKAYLDANYAKKLISYGFRNHISSNLWRFKQEDRKAIALMLVKEDGDVYLQDLDSKDLNLEFAKELHDNGLSLESIGIHLGDFLGKDRKAIALMVLKSGFDIDLNSLSADDMDNELANAMIDAGFKAKVKTNKKRFKGLSISTKMRLW